MEETIIAWNEVTLKDDRGYDYTATIEGRQKTLYINRGIVSQIRVRNSDNPNVTRVKKGFGNR